MRIIAPVTDYIRGSILTSQGDLVKHDGITPKRLPVGDPGNILFVSPSGMDIEYGTYVEKIYEHEYYGHNTAEITITSTSTLLVWLTLGSVDAGDRLIVNVSCKATKGLTEGLTHFMCLKESGTAEIRCLSIDVKFQMGLWQIASQPGQFQMSGIFRVDTAGTLSMQSMANSEGSNSVCAIGDAAMYINARKQLL